MSSTNVNVIFNFDLKDCITPFIHFSDIENEGVNPHFKAYPHDLRGLQSIGFNDFEAWKTKVIPQAIPFSAFQVVRAEGSGYIIVFQPKNGAITGVWDIAVNLGYIFQDKPIALTSIYEITPTIDIVLCAPQRLSKSNEALFKLDTVPRVIEVKANALKFLKLFIIDNDTRNKPPAELAIRAIRQAEEFTGQFEDYLKGYGAYSDY